MERLPLYRQTIQLIHFRKDTCFQRITASAEGIQGFAITEKDGFLAFVYDQLAACYKIRVRVPPDECCVIALKAYDTGNPRVTLLLQFHLRLNVLL